MPLNDPKPATLEAYALLRADERDWKTVELLLQHPDAPLSSVSFHAQQYLEKALKAVLVSNGVVFLPSHPRSWRVSRAIYTTRTDAASTR